MGSAPTTTVARQPDASRLPATTAGQRRVAFGPGDWGLVALVGGVLGASFLLVEIALQALPPAVIAAGRLSLGVTILSALPAARRPTLTHADRHRAWLLGILWMALPWTLMPVAQRYIDSSVAGMIGGAMPVFSAVIAALLMRRVPRLTQSAGILAGFAGVVTVVWPAAAAADADLFGVLLAVAASVLYALAANLAVPLQQRYGSLPVVLHAQRAALVALAPFAMIAFPQADLRLMPVAALLVLGTVTTVVAFVAMTTLFGRVGADRGAVAIYLVPIVALGLGVAVLNEPLHPMHIAGTSLVIAGAWLTGRTTPATRTDRASHNRTTETLPQRQGGNR